MTTTSNHSRAARRLGLAAGVGAVAAVLVTAGPASAAPSNTAFVAHDTLIVKGSNDDDRIALRLQAAAPGILEVDFGDDGTAEHSFDRATFSRINVFARRGDDQIRIDQVNGIFLDEAITVYAGSGDDRFDGGDGAELFIGGRGDDAADPNRGDDTGVMGSGTDTFRWDPGDGSDVVDGQVGFDTLDFNGAAANEIMSLSPNGERSVFLRDVANIRMDMDGVEALDLTALGGTDTFTANDMTGTDFRVAAVDLQGPAGGPDGVADVVTVKGSAGADRIELGTEGTTVVADGLQTEVRIAGSEVLLDKVQIDTLDGNDRVLVDGTVFALIDIGVDLGLGQS
jgi:hypothetical protein